VEEINWRFLGEELQHFWSRKRSRRLIRALEEEMFELAKNLEFERAAVVRDEIKRIREMSQHSLQHRLAACLTVCRT